MSESKNPELYAPGHKLTVDDVRAMTGSATPHFSLHLRNRLRRLIAELPEDDAARKLAELEIARLERISTQGQRGDGHPGLTRLDGGDAAETR